jgi:hypothetical protein
MKSVHSFKQLLSFCIVLLAMGANAQQKQGPHRAASGVVSPTVTPTAVTTTGGTANYVPKFTGAATVANSLIFDNGTNVGIGVGASPNSSVKLDVGGAMIMRGNMIVSRAGNATASKGYGSYGFEFFSNAYNSSTKAGDNPFFSLQSEPTGNNTSSPSATFNLLFSNNGAAAAETGFYINPNGAIHFASAQTFPIAAGPQGPAGPTGPEGPAGPMGPAGTITYPYYASADADGGAVFSIVNTSAGEPGISGTGAVAPAMAYFAGGYGVIGNGGSATATSGIHSFGGVGIYGNGGYAENSNSSGGPGALLNGGSAPAGSYGGSGVEVGGGSGTAAGMGGDGIDAYVGEYGEFAGYFGGDVTVLGTLYKSGGSFKIDHPLDPANKYLSHSFVESPDMMNIYNGNIVTDGRGEAVVTMPDYFEALNRDFRYQLTTIGQPAQAYIASEISNGVFVIKTDKPGVKVSWQVTGVRQDAWANAHRIPVDEEKPDREKGHYTYPELYGHAGEPSISDLRRRPRPKPYGVQ